MKAYFNDEVQQEIIFVDCFDTIILRNTSKKKVFENWARALEKVSNIHWKKLHRCYNRTNFWLCVKKFFTKFITEENFEFVLKKMFRKLFNVASGICENDFLENAKKVYLEKESECHDYNHNLIQFLAHQKNKGKKIYIVSDFYCSSTDIEKWLTTLGIVDLFDGVFSSADYAKEKLTGGLYRFLLKKLQISAKEVLMIGDNFWSDYIMAKSCGLQAKHINNERKKKYEK